MPAFTGDNPDSRLYQAKMYFDINLLTDAEKMTVSAISFSPKVVNWYRWTNNRRKVKSWKDLKTHLFEFYKPSQEISL